MIYSVYISIMCICLSVTSAIIYIYLQVYLAAGTHSHLHQSYIHHLQVRIQKQVRVFNLCLIHIILYSSKKSVFQAPSL